MALEKVFPLEKGEIEILHDTTYGKDIVRVTINGTVEFEYDVNKPDEEIIGHFVTWEQLTKGMTKEQIRNICP